VERETRVLHEKGEDQDKYAVQGRSPLGTREKSDGGKRKMRDGEEKKKKIPPSDL